MFVRNADACAPTPRRAPRQRLRLVTTLFAAAFIVGQAGVPVAMAMTTAFPNPCKIVAASAINTAIGAPAGVNIKGALSTRKVSGGTLSTCTYLYGQARLMLETAPRAYGKRGFAGPADMIVKVPKGFGVNGHLIYDTNAKHAFATVTFEKRSLYGAVWANGKVAPVRVLVLARLLYAKL